MARNEGVTAGVDPQTLVGLLAKKHGVDNVRIPGGAQPELTVYPTGIQPLDDCLGIGGLPAGRIVELYGPEMSGKSTVAMCVVAQAQQAGKTCVYVDMEQSLSVALAQAIGVDLDTLVWAQPTSGDDALKIALDATQLGAAVVVIDSVAALVPKAELDGEIGDAVMGAQARLMGQALRMITPAAAAKGTLVIFINQLREKLAVMYGNSEVTPGGRALRFYASVRVDVRRRGELIREGKENVGHHTHIKVTKNKLFPPYREADFDLLWGVSPIRTSLLPAAVARNVVQRQGSWFVFPDGSKALGQDKALQLLLQNDALFEQVQQLTRQTPVPNGRGLSVAADGELPMGDSETDEALFEALPGT